MNIFEQTESEVRAYCRSFPAIFDKARGSYLFDKDGKKYLDFFSGAGALNYGHNEPFFTDAMVDYIRSGGILHALDMSTRAKEEFLTAFKKDILDKRGLPYKVMFCAPTGTNAVEASLKLARKVTGRSGVFAFSGSFHGMTAGSLSVTSGNAIRSDLRGSYGDVTFLPYPFGFGLTFDTIEYLKNLLEDDHSGVARPAAIIFETVQAEGGVIVAPTEWLHALRKVCDDYGILLICDDIQVGCWRTGDYFSFERAGIVPDMVLLSKSISGVGSPMSLLLLKPELDVWSPGEHNGTFRGNQLAFVTAKKAIEYAEKKDMKAMVTQKEKLIEAFLRTITTKRPALSYRGLGMIYGLDFSKEREGVCKKVSAECFKNGLIIECAGRNKTVLKLMPPLTASEEELREGFAIIEKAVETVL